MLIVMLTMITCLMMIFAIYVTPFVLDISNCEPRSALEKAVEISLLLFSLFIGAVLSLVVIRFLLHQYSNEQQVNSWFKMYRENSKKLSKFDQWWQKKVFDLMIPGTYRIDE